MRNIPAITTALLISAVLTLSAAPSRAMVAEIIGTVVQTPATTRDPAKFAENICIALGRESLTNDLPAAFFTRLIYRESRFNVNARSHKGAEGIAQFMPGTARQRGLGDAYDPFQSLHESARWLGELRRDFGNLGLAAAAYNGGPRRIRDWLAGRGALPGETRVYVKVVTGRSADDWARPGAKDADMQLGNVIPCGQIAKLLAPPLRLTSQTPSQDIQPAAGGPTRRPAQAQVRGPWGLQLLGDWSERAALAQYRTLQSKFPTILGGRAPMVLRSRPVAGRGSATWYHVRVAEQSQESANKLCARLEAAGGQCLVLKN